MASDLAVAAAPRPPRSALHHTGAALTMRNYVTESNAVKSGAARVIEKNSARVRVECVCQRPASRGCSSPYMRRDERKQQVGRCDSAAENGVRPGVVIGAVVRIRQAPHSIARLDVEADAMAFREDHARRPDLDLEPHRLAGLEPLTLQVRMVGPEG